MLFLIIGMITYKLAVVFNAERQQAVTGIKKSKAIPVTGHGGL
jgi:hypothetical protein